MKLWIMVLLMAPAAAQQEWVGSAACAECHGVIAKRYAESAMARTSGSVSDAPEGSFLNSTSGAHYSIRKDGPSVRLEATRQVGGQSIDGAATLSYFLGAGERARGYLYGREGFLYEAPAGWLKNGGWVMAEGLESQSTMGWNLPATPECLACHATGVRARAGTQNGYEAQPFAESGIGCEGCHGPGRRHIEAARAGSGAAAAILNPAKEQGFRRESVCAACHLFGANRIERSGRKITDFRPGQMLLNTATTFVWQPPVPGSIPAGQYEDLSESLCKRVSQDRLWCGSCHDAHGEPPAEKKVEFYREKCQSCHESKGCTLAASEREANGNNCIGCHMPVRPDSGRWHISLTDHSIPRKPGESEASNPDAGNSVNTFWGEPMLPRERGLMLFSVGMQRASGEDLDNALAALKEAETQGFGDAHFLAQLATLYDRAGETAKAVERYRKAVAADPSEGNAAVNLGTILAEQGQMEEAIAVWQKALTGNPGLETARLDLAVAYMKQGKREEARREVERLLEFNPDMSLALQLLEKLGK